MPGGEPATMTTRSPIAQRPISSSAGVDLPHHLVGVADRGHQEGLDPPGQRELAAHLGPRRERQQRDRPSGSAPAAGPTSPVWVKATRNFAPTTARRPRRPPRRSPRPWCAARWRSAAGGRAPRSSIVLDDPGHRLDRLDRVAPRRWSRRRASPRRRRRARRWRRRRPRRGSAAAFSIIDSSIWVATMTGLAVSRAISTARFCTIGTCSSGSSTPRSPRATMMPSKASTISSRLLDGLRLLDLGDDRQRGRPPRP